MRARRVAVHADHLDPIKTAHELYDTYDYASFTVADGVTNYDCDAQQSALFKNAPQAFGIIIWADQDLTIRFNDTDMPGIVHEAIYAPHEWFDKLKISNVYITNASGSTANVKVFLI